MLMKRHLIAYHSNSHWEIFSVKELQMILAIPSNTPVLKLGDFWILDSFQKIFCIKPCVVTDLGDLLELLQCFH